MSELGHPFDSTNQSTQWAVNKEPGAGAGANAGSREDTMFVANGSLSELVWSPSKGLSIKCADCSLADKNNSHLGCSESGNMITLPLQSIKGKEIENNGTVNEENLSSNQLAPNPETENSIRETLGRSPSGCVGIMPLCGTRSHEHNPRSCGIMDPTTTKLSVVDVKSNRDDESAKKEMDICSHSDTRKDGDIYENRTDTIAALHNDASAQGRDNARSANSSSNGQEEPRPDLVLVKPEIGDLAKGVSSDKKVGDVGGGDIQAASSVDILAYGVSKMKQYDLPKRSRLIGSPDVKQAESFSVFEENGRNKLSTPEKQESIAENDIKPLKTEGKLCRGSACTEVGIHMIVASPPEGEGKHSPENMAMLIEAPLNERGSYLKRRKGEENSLSDTEVNRSISKEEDGSHESVESRNSGQVFSKGRRAGCFERQLVIGNKKMKRHHLETPCSAPFVRQDSSFMNWISNMTKGFSKLDSDEKPCSALAAEPSHHQFGSHDSIFISLDKNKEDPVGRSTGFQNIFQSLYCPKARIQNKIKCSLDQQTKELQVANKIPCDNDNTTSNEEKPKQHKFIHMGTSTLPNVSSAKITFFKEKPSNSCNTACDSKMGGLCLSNSCFKNDSGSPEDAKASVHGSVDHNKFSNSVTNINPLESLWITRFCPKVTTQMLNSVQSHQDKDETIEGFTDCNRLLPLSQNVIVSLEDKKNIEDGHVPSFNDQMNALNCSISPSGSCGSVRNKIHSDQNFKYKVNPILPSQGFKSTEAMASIFARRLDAFRHIIAPEITDNATHSAVLCVYCGKRGHALRDCSEIIESELKDLLKNANLYDSFEETSRLCIRCFQLSHWAVGCPYSSSMEQTCQDGNPSFLVGENSERILNRPQNQNPLLGTCTISHGENSRLDNEFMVRNNKISGTMILNQSLSDFKPVKRDLLGQECCEEMSWKRPSQEFILNGKNAASSSKGNEFKENQIISYVNKQIPTISRGTFEIIKRLRLSRANILKWMKSPISNFCLEGFFLRVRLGKWEEGLEGTGYHVACISGASHERSNGKCQLSISVDIGGLKCSVDCRYVSNHDFIEDELVVWWCANLKGACKLPSIEELNMKLVEKEKYGL